MSLRGDSRPCIAVTKAGKPCRAVAVTGSDKCAAHSGQAGAAVGNKNRETHGFYTAPLDDLAGIEDVIRDMLRRQTRLSRYLDRLEAEGAELASKEIVSVLALHGQNASRIGRLLRDQKVVESKEVDELLEKLGPVLDELASELGIEL